MQTLLFRSLNTIINTDKLHRRAFNSAFSTLGLDWYWQKDTYARLCRIIGERHRVVWYAEHCQGIRMTCGFADKICWQKEKALKQLLDHNYVRARPGVIRLLEEAAESNIETALYIGSTPVEHGMLRRASHTFSAMETLQIYDDPHSRQTRVNASTPDHCRHSRSKNPAQSTAVISLNQSEFSNKTGFAGGLHCFAHAQSREMGAGERFLHSCISHLGEPDDPASHLFGLNVLDKGVASLRTLSALEMRNANNRSCKTKYSKTATYT